MLGWMHQNEAHRGFLELPNGEPMTEKQISLRIGRSLKEVRPLLAELKSFGVFSVTPSGALYCRRMARETHISEVRRAAAKSRADKSARAVDGSFVRDVAGLGDGEFAPAKAPASGEENTVLSSSSSSSSSSSVSVKATPCASNSDAHLTGLPGDDLLFGTPERTIPVARRASQMSAEQEGWFATWWAEYWRHVAKKAAREAFRKQVRTGARYEQVMAATRAQKAEMLSREESVRPHGSTWLHGERWADETAVDPVGSSATRKGVVSGGIEAAMRLLTEQEKQA
jgi:hypothetical protein